MRRAPIEFASYIGPGYFLRLAALDHAFKGKHGKRFLEVGPGRGDIAAWLISRGADGILVDTSPASLEYLRSRFSSEKSVSVTGEIKSVAIGSQDLAIAFEVLEHVPDDKGLLSEMRGVLKPDGRVLISVPAFMKRWGELDECVGHLRRYERADIAKLLNESGFDLEDLLCYGFPVCTVFSLMRKVYYTKSLDKLRHESASSRTGRSGVERPLNVRSMALVRFLYMLVLPMVLIQCLTLHKSIGEGWIAVARLAEKR
jgi:SAM-dependent methyltransferase